MKKSFLLVVFVVFVATSQGFAINTDPATGEAKAKIVQPISVAHVTNAALDFGVLVQPTSQETLTLTAAASTAITPSAGLNRITSFAPSSDHFTVVNQDDVAYTVTVPATFQVTSGSNSMTVSEVTSSCTSNCHDADIYVGGKLTLSANQAPGDYTGTYTVTLTY